MSFGKLLVALGMVGCGALVGAAGCTVTTVTGGDGGNDDAAIDTGAKETGAKDTGTNNNDGGPMCPAPADVTSYTPKFHAPNPSASKCSDGDVTTYWTDCVDQYDQTKCDASGKANAACAACMETLDPSDASWGAIVDRGPYVYLNLAGCVQLMGDATCAQAIQAADLCEDAACLDQCWNGTGMSQSDADAVDQCYAAVEKAGCKKYFDDITTKCKDDAGTAYGICNVQFAQAGFNQYAKLFCQGGG